MSDPHIHDRFGPAPTEEKWRQYQEAALEKRVAELSAQIDASKPFYKPPSCSDYNMALKESLILREALKKAEEEFKKSNKLYGSPACIPAHQEANAMSDAPNVVWVYESSIGLPGSTERHGGWFEDAKHGVQGGAYVNIDWFMAEVERRAKKKALSIANHIGSEYYEPHCYWQEHAEQLAKAIKEGK